MNRAHYYNKYRAYRVISQRGREHPITWEPWMRDFPVDRQDVADATPGRVVVALALSRRWQDSEQGRRERLKQMVLRGIRLNLLAARQEDYDYETILDSITVKTRPLSSS